MANAPRWASNKVPVGDRKFVTARVEAGALYLNSDPAQDRFVEIELAPPPPPETLEWIIDMAGYTEVSGKRLIPVSVGHEIHDMTIQGLGTIAPDWIANPAYETHTSPFAISITFDGNVLVSQPDPTTGLNPPDNATTVILNITAYRTRRTDNPAVISQPKGPVAIKVTGDAVISDTTPPTILSISPGGIDVPVASDITISFSETVQRGTSGTITLWNEITNNAIEVFDVATAPTSGPGSIAISLSQVTLNPTNALPNGTGVSIRFTAGAIRDLASTPNGMAAITTNVWSFVTVASQSSSSFDPDVTVSSVTSIISTLQAWAANWNGTVPSGKSTTDYRVIGYNASLGSITLTGISLPQRVYIRAVGSFGLTALNGFNEPSCTVFIQGTVRTTNCTNIVWYLNDLRVPTSAAFINPGWFHFTGCTNCGSIRNALSGWRHPLVQNNNNTTQNAIRIDGCTDFVFRNNYYSYILDSSIALFGNNVRTTVEGNTGRHTTGNDFKLASNSVNTDLHLRYNMWDRVRHASGSLHGDVFQYNIGAVTHRLIYTHNCAYRGHWTASYLGTPNDDDVTQHVFRSQGGNTSTGPDLFEHNFVATAQQRGVDKVPGGAVLTARYNTMLNGVYPVGQRGSAPYPRIIAADVSERNFITAPSSNPSMVVNEGTNGVKKLVGTAHTEILDEHEGIPTDVSTLWQVRPKSGQAVHPAFTPSANRVGCWQFWEMMLAADARVCLSKVGWPVASVFVEDFDPNDDFWGGYTGAWDANGDTV